MVTLKIPESHLSHLRPAYEKIYAELLERIESVASEWRDLAPMLDQLGIAHIPPEKIFLNSDERMYVKGDLQANKIFHIVDNDSIFGVTLKYDPNASWLERAKFVIREARRSLTTNEIVEAIGKYQRELLPSQIANSIPATLSVAAKDGKIQRNEDGGIFRYSLK